MLVVICCYFYFHDGENLPAHLFNFLVILVHKGHTETNYRCSLHMQIFTWSATSNHSSICGVYLRSYFFKGNRCIFTSCIYMEYNGVIVSVCG